MRMVFLETFLPIPLRTLRHLVLECSIHGIFMLPGKIPVQASTRQPAAESGDRDKDTIPTPRFLRSPSARNSFNPLEGRNFKNYGTDQQRIQISELHFDKFLTPHTFSCWKIRFKTEVRFCSNFPKEAKRRIKEVKMVNSVDDLKSPCSIQRITPFPDFELLDARIASALNKIIQNSCFKKEISLEEQKVLKADQFLCEKQIAYLIYDNFRVTCVNDSVLDYANLFSSVLRNDNIQEFDRRWDEIFLSMAQFPLDDILESLYKIRIRESEKIKTVLEVYNMEIHQKKTKPDYHKLMAMVKRSIKQNLRLKVGELSHTYWSTIRGNNVAFTKDKENVGNGKPTGSARKETNAVSSTMAVSVQKLRHRRLLLQNLRRNHKMWKIHLGVEVHLGEFLVCRASIILKVLERIHSVKSGIPRVHVLQVKSGMQIRGNVLFRTPSGRRTAQ